MVDLHTYRQLHPDPSGSKKSHRSKNDYGVIRMDASVMDADEPPPSPEIYVLPEIINGYNLRTKKWGMYESPS